MKESETANSQHTATAPAVIRGGFARGAVSVVLIISFLIGSLQLLSSDNGGVQDSTQQNGSFVFTSSASSLLSDSLSEIYNMPVTYVLEYNDNAAPEPDSDGFTQIYDDERQNYDGTPIDYYEDETIWVKCWKEKIDGVIYCFAEVEIAHPSQFKRKLAGDVISNKSLDYPLNLFQEVNGVVGMNADYCAFRPYATIIHYGKVLRESGSINLDILIYDSEGNLSSMTDKAFLKSDLYTSDDVIFTFNFGPVLVDDYEVSTSNRLSEYPIGEVKVSYPRTAIAQFGYENHYLLCTTEKATTEEFAAVIQKKGVRFAYNLDGGQSATLMFNGEVFNNVAYGGQREVSDILYFATAIPND